VLISGATGWHSEGINGFFAPTQERGLDGRVVYSKCGCDDTVIVHRNGRWAIKAIDNKSSNHSAANVLGGCCLEECGSRPWTVYTHKEGMVPQTLNIETGPEVERKVSNRCKHALHSSHVNPLKHLIVPLPLMCFSFEQAAEHTAAVARAIAEDNARAVPVLISGATGPYGKGINGLFAPTSERSLDGRVVYEKCDNTGIIIEHYSGQWSIKPATDKGLSALQGGVVGGCALESCIGRVWFVGMGRSSTFNNCYRV
jgi:hypothetical protein